TRLLAHRGPDDEGYHVGGGIGLGHRRLAVVDASPQGHQPMGDSSRGLWLSYNGEFYNHRDYRPRLEAHGYRFRGQSDTETLLYLLDRGGPDALAEVAGIFGLALWDERRRRLVLARDPVGVKQLYYHDDGRRIVFASEIKALLACPWVPRRIDLQAVNEYLHFHTPLFERTFFEGIEAVRPGEYLEITGRGVRPRVYWHLGGFDPRPGAPEEHVQALRALLSQVVREQLMSDGPVGTFFSGGIDSSAVASFAVRQGFPLQGYGVHFKHPDVIDERPFQEAAARAIGLPLELITVDAAGFPDDLMRLSYLQDQPVIGAAMVPMYHVSRLAARAVKVCLGGQG
ncbi:MAG TPA: asparagine synthase (glutamine-hydrolyzing), partial [Myxococcota bacterium]|nr:asparagine synthase (glutamine-hydrolyzing) [Myxococcota bacterium]